jgi:transcriptional regulator with XRE-family HTH domain
MVARDIRSLREWRAARVLTMAELAAAAHVTTSTVFGFEHGTRVPRPRTIRALAAALGIEPGQIAEAVTTDGATSRGAEEQPS